MRKIEPCEVCNFQSFCYLLRNLCLCGSKRPWRARLPPPQAIQLVMSMPVRRMKFEIWDEGLRRCKACWIRVCLICELRVCELRVCELRVCEFTVGIYCLENAHLSVILCALTNWSYILYVDRSFHSKKCSRFTFSNFSNFGGKMTSSFWRQYFV
jgi:hypothetical protein